MVDGVGRFFLHSKRPTVFTVLVVSTVFTVFTVLAVSTVFTVFTVFKS